MTIQTTYIQARDGLVKLLDQVTHNREVVIIQYCGEEVAAMIVAFELESLMASAHTRECGSFAIRAWVGIKKMRLSH